MIKGKLFGIGVGPGDPELLTFKAVETIRRCEAIAVPEPDGAEKTAYTIVEKYLDGKSLIPCGFSMQRDEKKRIEQRREIGCRICGVLESGRSVGFITLGDPMVYSTFSYVLEDAVSKGFEAETIPGITSFSAAAAALNLPLCEGREPLHILPAGEEADIEQWLDLPGTKVFMKSGRNVDPVLNTLRQCGLGDQTRIVVRCTMEGQRIYDTIDRLDRAGEELPLSYFSIIIVKEKQT